MMNLALVSFTLLVACAFASSGAQSDRRKARDAKFFEYVGTLEGGKTKVLEYKELVGIAKQYKVVVLGGYSGLGYKDPRIVRAYIEELMHQTGDDAMYVLGATSDGIGQAYSWIPEIAAEAKVSNIKTAGIVSRNAAEYGIARQDYVVFVDTDVDDWQVRLEGRSLMVDIAARTRGRMAYFKGGSISKLEIEEALDRGVAVTLYANEEISPDPIKVKKRLDRDPDYVVDGTASLAQGRIPADHQRLITIIKD